jgi:hypothetical protein
VTAAEARDKAIQAALDAEMSLGEGTCEVIQAVATLSLAWSAIAALPESLPERSS